MGSIHTTLSSGGSLQPLLVIFCHQSSAVFSLLLSSPLLPLLLVLFFFFLLPFHPLCLYLGPPVGTVDFCRFVACKYNLSDATVHDKDLDIWNRAQ